MIVRIRFLFRRGYTIAGLSAFYSVIRRSHRERDFMPSTGFSMESFRIFQTWVTGGKLFILSFVHYDVASACGTWWSAIMAHWRMDYRPYSKITRMLYSIIQPPLVLRILWYSWIAQWKSACLARGSLLFQLKNPHYEVECWYWPTWSWTSMLRHSWWQRKYLLTRQLHHNGGGGVAIEEKQSLL